VSTGPVGWWDAARPPIVRSGLPSRSVPSETLQECRDEAVIPAAPDAVWDVLTDLTTYGSWWTLVRCRPLGPTRLEPGVRFEFSGSRGGGPPTTSWVIEVEALEPGRRIDLRYVEGDLLGPVGWELEAADGGTRTAYVYRGVRANAPGAQATFDRYGTRLHNVAMRVDALSGLARFVRGEPLDDAWRARVGEAMATGVAVL
jgi:uncharacterized protein YndB with AHSA1/START domain